MDTPNLLVVALVVGLILVAPRVAASMGTTGDVLAQLFVPPDRGLGWPHGVQERDEPWAWRAPSRPFHPEPEAATLDEPALFELVDLGATVDAAGGLVVDVAPVPAGRPHRVA
jgi:hypothetical protein